MFTKLYASPWGRLLRRFVVVGLSASLAFLLLGLDASDPLKFVNGLLAFNAWGDLTKVFIGAGALSMLDKLRRELANIKK